MDGSLLFPQPLPPKIDRHFASLCQALSVVEVIVLRESVEVHLNEIRRALRRNEFLDLALAEQIARHLFALLDSYAQRPEPDQALIVGAARYFTRTVDAEPDTEMLGLEDDLAVLNFVAATVGRPDLRIEIPDA